MTSIFIAGPQVIDTNDPEREIWQHIGYFESEHYASNQRNARIADGVLAAHCTTLISAKQTHNSNRVTLS